MSPSKQLPLFPQEIGAQTIFPSTRFQGSKRKHIEWIRENMTRHEFDSVLDVFGGTGIVSYLFKMMGKEVTYNDMLTFNWQIGLALIENAEVTLSPEEVDDILTHHNTVDYPDFISRTFGDIYFTDEENYWLDVVIHNINGLIDNRYKQALAYFALFQACIIKRPYNLFHRANLYMRTADVSRSFGNKITWDTPFESHFRAFVDEANRAVFDNQRDNRALNLDAFETPVGADLVYLDPPYVNAQKVGVDYRDFYHFLEGITHYDEWPQMIDYKSKHKRLLPVPSMWTNAATILDAFDTVVARHRDSMIVISYRDDGIPSQAQLIDMLKTYKSQVVTAMLPQKYVLSKRHSHELLLIA